MSAPSDPTPHPALPWAAGVHADAEAADRDREERTSDRLEELERLQALVVSTTAHEMRTPLTVLRAHAAILMEDADHLRPQDRASVEAIETAVTRLQEVADHLVSELRGTAGGAEDALRRWLQLEHGSARARPTAA